MNPKELKYRQSQRYSAIMDRQPTRPLWDWTCPNCGGTRYRRNWIEDKQPVQKSGQMYWYMAHKICDNHVPSKEDVVRHLLSRVK